MGKVYTAAASVASARASAQFVRKKEGLVGQCVSPLDVLRLHRLPGLVEEALDGPKAVLLTGGELRRIDLAQPLLGPVDALLRRRAEPLLVGGAQHG
jgi:hypothetical protein